MLRCKISRELRQCRCFVSALVTLKVVTKAWDVFFGLHGQTDGTLTVIVRVMLRNGADTRGVGNEGNAPAVRGQSLQFPPPSRAPGS